VTFATVISNCLADPIDRPCEISPESLQESYLETLVFYRKRAFEME